MSNASGTNRAHHRRIQLRDVATVQAVEALAEMDRRTPAAQVAWLVEREWNARQSAQRSAEASAAAVVAGEPHAI